MNKLKTTVHVKKLYYYEAYQIKNILTTRYRFLKAMFYIASYIPTSIKAR